MLIAAIARYLDELGIVTYDPAGVEGDCFLEHVPDEPDELTLIFGSGGFSQSSRLPWDRATVQIRTRGPRYQPRPSVDRQRAIYDALTGLDNVTLAEGTVDETRIIAISPLQAARDNPVSLGRDDNQRPEHTLNYIIQVHAPTTHRPAIT